MYTNEIKKSVHDFPTLSNPKKNKIFRKITISKMKTLEKGFGNLLKNMLKSRLGNSFTGPKNNEK